MAQDRDFEYKTAVAPEQINETHETVWVEENRPMIPFIIRSGTRVKILKLLMKRPFVSVSYIAKICRVSKPTVVHHLKILEDYKVVVGKWYRNYHHQYAISKEYPRWTRVVMKEFFEFHLGDY